MSPRCDTVLSVDNVTVRFGGTLAVDGVSLTIRSHSAHALIGPNGAGKTTLLNGISRLVRISGGPVVFGTCDLATVRADQLAAMGLSRTFQAPILVEDMTVTENVALGLYAGYPTRLWEDLAGAARATRQAARRVDLARQAAAELGLAPVAERRVRELSFGTRKLVDLARAWAPSPRFLMLDEPTAGLNDPEVDRLAEFIARVKTQTTILVVTHHLGFVMNIADHITVLDHGAKIAEGPPQAVRHDPVVIASYTGIGR